MGELVDLMFFLLTLNSLNVSEHGALSEILGEFLRLESVEMETGKGDELPGISETAKISAEGFNLRVGHTESRPVERWREVVCKEFIWPSLSDEGREFSGSLNGRSGGFHPDHIGVSKVLSGTGSAELDGSVNRVESFSGSEGFPVNAEGESEGLSQLDCLSVRELVALGEPVSGD